MSSNCSFRITRTTEDLAQTITALSQRLIKLEQRFEAIELQINQSQVDMPVQELEMLDGIDQQLKECNELLKTSSIVEQIKEQDNLQIESNEEEANSDELIEDESPIDEVTNPIWIEENKEETFAA